MDLAFPFTVNEVQLKQENDTLFLDLYFVGETHMLHYHNGFMVLPIAFLPGRYAPIHLLRTPFTILEIREHEDMDNRFFYLDNGGLLRTNIRDFSGDKILETIEFYPNDDHPDSYFATLMTWFEEANPLSQ